MDILVTIAL